MLNLFVRKQVSTMLIYCDKRHSTVSWIWYGSYFVKGNVSASMLIYVALFDLVYILHQILFTTIVEFTYV